MGSNTTLNMLKVLFEQFEDLRKPIADIELNRAKNIVKMNILMALESQQNRTEEIVRNLATYD